MKKILFLAGEIIKKRDIVKNNRKIRLTSWFAYDILFWQDKIQVFFLCSKIISQLISKYTWRYQNAYKDYTSMHGM